MRMPVIVGLQMLSACSGSNEESVVFEQAEEIEHASGGGEAELLDPGGCDVGQSGCAVRRRIDASEPTPHGMDLTELSPSGTAMPDDGLFDRALRLAADGRMGEAMPVIRDLISQYPDSRHMPTVYVIVGDWYFDEGNVTNAQRFYERAMRFRNSSTFAYASYRLAFSLLATEAQRALEQFARAWARVRRNRTLEPRLGEPLLRGSAWAYAAIGRPAMATEYLRRTYGEESTRDGLGHLAIAYEAAERSDAAIAMYDALLTQFPDDESSCDWQYERSRLSACIEASGEPLEDAEPAEPAVTGVEADPSPGPTQPAAMAPSASRPPPQSANRIPAVAHSTAIGPALNGLVWGMSRAAVTAHHEQRLRAEADVRLSQTQDIYVQDRVRRRLARDMRRIETSFVEFNGQRGGWDVSVIDDQFAHDNAESMLLAWTAQDVRTFYFFLQGRLWRVVRVFEARTHGPDSAAFAESIVRRFGSGTQRTMSLGGRTQPVLEWQDDTTRLRTHDRSSVYGAFCLVFTDRAVHARMPASRR